MDDLNKIKSVLEKRNLFLTGGAGVGKSYLTNVLIKDYRKDGKQVVALGSTGVSAVNVGGYTIHSFFVFGISSNFEELARHDKYNKARLKELAKILKATNLIIIDEISMVSCDMMDLILYRLENASYQGKVMLVGDFYQLPPIVKHETKDRFFSGMLYAFESMAWRSLDPKVMVLTEMKRTDDGEFTHILSKVRRGVCDSEVIDYMISLCNHEDVYESRPTYLFGRNIEVEHMNKEQLEQLDGEEVVLFAKLTKHTDMNQKRVDSWKKQLPISDELRLKVGAPVLFTVNKWGSFVNGDRGLVKSIHDEHIVIEKDDRFIRLEKHEFDMSELKVNEKGELKEARLVSLSQYPIKLAYAVTIHKSQGMSIENLVCNVDHIFAPSQFYVAISRATNPKGLKLDFTKGDISSYIDRVVRVDSRVVGYYGELK